MPTFPTIVYRVPGRHRGPGGLTHDTKGVETQEQYDALQGWHDSQQEAVDAYEAALTEAVKPKRGRPRRVKADADPA